MGGRKGYSSRKVTGKGLGKYKKQIDKAIKDQKPLDIAISTTRAALDNKKQEKQFNEIIKVLYEYISKPKEKVTTKEKEGFTKIISDVAVDKKPLTTKEKELLDYAKKLKRRPRK